MLGSAPGEWSVDWKPFDTARATTSKRGILMDCVLVAGLAFLLGFKIAAHMGKRHLEQMRDIWRASTPKPNITEW